MIKTMKKFENTDKKILELEKRLQDEKAARQRAEKHLEDQNQKLNVLNEKISKESRLLEATVINAKDAVMIITADLNRGDPKIVYVNNAFTTISGYTAEEVI